MMDNDDMMTAASLVAGISDNLGIIDHSLAPIKQLQKQIQVVLQY